MNSEAIFESIVINGLRAAHKRNVEVKFYRQQKSYYYEGAIQGTMEDLLKLESEEAYIESLEDEWLEKFSNFEIPEWISVKQYAEVAGISIWKVYREIQKGNILADKIKNRWHIYTSISTIEQAA